MPFCLKQGVDSKPTIVAPTVAAVYDRRQSVVVSFENGCIPLLAEEGWMRGQLKSCEATLFRADGVVSLAPIQAFAGLTTPSAPDKEAPRHLY